MAFEHELSWSASRAGTFDACRRRYFNDYYHSWNGWLRDTPEERQKLWRLKKMTRMPMLAGDVLHQAIAEYFDLRSEGRELLEDDLVGLAVKKLRDGYKQSRDGAGLWRDRPSQNIHLAEHYYAEPSVDEGTSGAGDYGKKYVGRLQAGGHFFMTSPELAHLHELEASDVLCVEGRAPGDRQNRDLPTFDLFGTKVYAIPDFAYRTATESGVRTFIYDWKSGSPREQDEFQLGVYALYAMDTWGVSCEEVTCVDVYLTQGEMRSRTYDEVQLEPILGRIEESLGAMRALHFDAGGETGNPVDFPQVEEGSRECTQCNYREVCGR
jgi:hypothetical protein